MTSRKLSREQVSSQTEDPKSAVRGILPYLLRNVEERLAAHDNQRPNTPNVQTAMTDAQISRYRKAIVNLVLSRNVNVVTPELLFEAADMAIAGEISTSEAHVGLQPGTMNPVHYGHLSASLAGILVNNLDLVFLASGAEVPDKPTAASSQIRNEMLRIATRGRALSKLLRITPIRQQIAEMFSVDKQTLLVAGENELTRRANMDIAAFIWLFRANPRVKWTYLVGSDKVARYGKLGEYNLVTGTLADHRANVRVLYFVRDDEDIDVANHIAPYGWMWERWQTGLFKKSSLPTCAISSFKIKTALTAGRDDIDGLPLNECLPEEVLTYIRTHKTLLSSYAREVEAREGQIVRE